jgi:hypothetical protein
MGLRTPGVAARSESVALPTCKGRAWVSDPAEARSDNVALPRDDRTCEAGRAWVSDPAEARSESVALPRSEARSAYAMPTADKSESVALPRDDRGGARRLSRPWL